MAEKRARFRYIVVLATVVVAVTGDYLENPKFRGEIVNVTVIVGRTATLTCEVEHLGGYKVAWLRVDTQTILTIHNHVITKNQRIDVSHSESKMWFLHIKDVRESDRGWYMCQINTDPMKSQVGYLDVVVPPDILDYPTSTDMVVREGSNVNLRCVAKGLPEPSVYWRRADGWPFKFPNGTEEGMIAGSVLNLTQVTRQQMGPYLCIASNGIPPTVSKRIMLTVHFPPMIWIQNQLVGAYEGQQITLECHSEAFPKSINYWTTDKGEIVAQSAKFEPSYTTDGYRIYMNLTIKSISFEDYGNYKCISKNSLGDMEGIIRVFPIPKPSKLSNGLSRKGLDDQPDSLFQEGEDGSGSRAKTELIFAFLVALPLVLQ